MEMLEIKVTELKVDTRRTLYILEKFEGLYKKWKFTVNKQEVTSIQIDSRVESPWTNMIKFNKWHPIEDPIILVLKGLWCQILILKSWHLKIVFNTFQCTEPLDKVLSKLLVQDKTAVLTTLVHEHSILIMFLIKVIIIAPRRILGIETLLFLLLFLNLCNRSPL